jgi:hypothetical protein
MNSVKGQDTDRRRLIGRLASSAFMVLDESHNAGGTDAGGWETKGADNRSDFLKKAVGSSKAVMFSSATYAKRPGTMALYAKTDMGKAVESPYMLGELISAGGVPMQQVVASMLAKAGQYIRRERSFEGVSYDVEPVTVDIGAYGVMSRALASIARFDIDLKKSDTFDDIKEGLKDEADALAMDSATGGTSVQSTNFTSLMHNIISQMLLSLKSNAVADRAIEALKAGEKPVITVANTMGAFIANYAESANLKKGDAVNVSFRDVLHRYLERTRRLTIKHPDGTKSHFMIPLSALPGDLLDQYELARATIEKLDTSSLPLSPIDWIKFRIASAGYRISEITGRKDTLDYTGPDKSVLNERPDSDVSPAGRRVNIDKFNRGALDVMILNRAGSTGLSLHSSAKFKDQKRRRMIIAQAELNIDVHMQMLGRVHRTGQVIPPAFTQAYADVPAEARPAAVLAKKMASLNANTTASRKSAFSADDGIDFLNEYGDQVAREYLAENLDVAIALDVDPTDTEAETARVFTGNLLLLPVDEQRKVLDEITSRYKSLIENLDAMGENGLEAKTMDLKAETTERVTIKEAEGESPFTQAVTLETVKVNASGKALAMDEIIQTVEQNISGQTITPTDPGADLKRLEGQGGRIANSYESRYLPEFDKMAADEIRITKSDELKAERREKHAENRKRWINLLRMTSPGSRVAMATKDGTSMVGIVLKVSRRNTGSVGNPLALGAWSVEIAIPDNAQRITVPFSSLAMPDDIVPEGARRIRISPPDWAQDWPQVIDSFDKARQTGRETRHIVTGNILAGFDQTKGNGQIINYTDAEGNVKPGILMNKAFSAKAFFDDRAVRFKTGDQVIQFLDQTRDAEIESRDKLIAVRKAGSGFEIELPAGRGTGGVYFLNPGVRSAAYDNFVKVGTKMRHTARDRTAAARVLDAMIQTGALFQTTDNQDVAEQIIKGSPSPQVMGNTGRQIPGMYSGLIRAVESLKQEKAPASQWMGTIRNQPGVKPEEIAWLGLEDWLASQTGTITKAAMLDFLRANQVQVSEVSKGQSVPLRPANIQAAREWAKANLTGRTGDVETALTEIDRAVDGNSFAVGNMEALGFPENIVQPFRDHVGNNAGPTKFSQYQLPGGENYRELLLTLPMQSTGTELKRGLEIAQGPNGWNLWDSHGQGDWVWRKGFSTREAALAAALKDDMLTTPSKRNDYTSSHWDEPNVLGHIRFNDRVDADGRKILFIEEAQSDWLQAGRKKGFKPAPNPAEEARLRAAYEKAMADFTAFKAAQPKPLTMDEANKIAERIIEKENEYLTAREALHEYQLVARIAV